MYVEHHRRGEFDEDQTDICHTHGEDRMSRTIEREDEYTLPAVQPVAPVQQVLAALADPVRLEMVRRLAERDEPIACSDLYSDISKSTASHHFKTLREAGLTERVVIAGQTYQKLRAREVEEALPGVLSAVVAAAGS
jgi:DNA-binding transcriptional ArsR family regulator